jgi:ribosome biogenesis protein MAK21
MKASMPPTAGDDDNDDEDEDALLGPGSEEEAPSAFEEENDLENGHDDEFSLLEASDDLLDPTEASVDLIEYDTIDCGAEEWSGLGGSVDVTDNKRKRSRGGNDGAPARRKKLRSLPTFASYEDYARMIEDGPEDDL